MQFTDFIKPELLMLVPVLIFIGKVFKDSSRIDSAMIPVYLGIIGIILTVIWILATAEEFKTRQEIFTAIFTAIVQGILVAGAAVYGNQIFQQLQRRSNTKAVK